MFIAMLEKLLRVTPTSGFLKDLYLELEARVFDRTPAVTRVYLLLPLTFDQAFALYTALMLFIPALLLLAWVRKKDSLNK